MNSEEALVAIVTGGAQGTGRAISDALLNVGYKVCIADINPLSGQKTREELASKYGKANVVFMTCDVTKEHHIDSMFTEVLRIFKHCDVLVNNAGVVCEKDISSTLRVNLVGPIFGCQAAFKFMGKDKGGNGGKVINVASCAGILPSPKCPIYTSTMHAVLGLTKCYACPYYQNSGITFNALCPAYALAEEHEANEDRPPESSSMMDPSYVAKGVMKLLEDGQNGASLVVTKSCGFEYIIPNAQLANIYNSLH